MAVVSYRAVLAVCLAFMLLGAVHGDVVTTTVNMVVKGCASGVGAAACLCKSSGGGNCLKMMTDLCRKNANVCKQVAGPICKMTGTYASSCEMAVKTATSPLGGVASSLFG